MHPRQHIRQAFVDRLSGVTMAKDNVYASRIKPLFDQFLPAILLYTQDESVEEHQWDGDGFTPLKRKLMLEIEAVIQGGDDLDNKLDQFAYEIEQALDDWNIPNRIADTLRLEQTESSIVADGSKVYGVTRLTYSLIYRTAVK